VIGILDKPHDVAGQPHTKVFNRHSNRKRRKRGFSFEAKRRHEIVRHGRHVGASDNHLIAWAQHNSKATDPIWSIMNAARNMGRKVTEAEAAAMHQRAQTTFKPRSADAVGVFLGLTHDVRLELQILTIGGIGVDKEGRKEIRKIRDKARKQDKRRANGVQPRSEYLLKSRSRNQPWKDEGRSRASWYRLRRQQAIRLRSRETDLRGCFDAASGVVVETTPSAAISKQTADTLVSPLTADRLVSPSAPPQWQVYSHGVPLTKKVREMKERLAHARGGNGGWR